MSCGSRAGWLILAYCLLSDAVMSVYLYTCERCQEPFFGNTYRVISDSDGVRLLDMIVCYGCFLEASRLGLTSESIETAHAALH